MKFSPSKVIKLIVPFIVFFVLLACNKDSDLLDDHIVADAEAHFAKDVIFDDYFTLSGNQPIELDVLSNDNFVDPKNVTIVDVSEPENGTVIINKNNTITYIPDGGSTAENEVAESENTDTSTDNTSETDTTDNSHDGYEESAEADNSSESESQDTTSEESNSSNESESGAQNTDTMETDSVDTSSESVESDTTESTNEDADDSFTYTTESKNQDDTLSTQEGTVTVTKTEKGTIDLNSLKAFPSAFGAGKNATGGRGGKIMVVTNLRDSGPGSFRAAWEATYPRTVIIKVEGNVNLQSPLTNQSTNGGNLTIWGQFAPGRGLTVTGDRISMSNAGNIIIRHVTFQNKNVDCIPNAGCFNSLTFYKVKANSSMYIDHVSTRYGADETLDMNSYDSGIKTTMANNLLAEGNPTHNTGTIVGDFGTGTNDVGSHTIARNMYYNISHRLPNVSGASGSSFEVYNQLFSNWKTRIMRTNGNVEVDFFNNYGKKGNTSFDSSIPVNKMGKGSDGSYLGFKTYTGFNYIDDYAEKIENNQTNLWVNYKDNGEGRNNSPIANSHYSQSRINNFGNPSDGIWNTNDVPEKIYANVGHNRGVNANGSPGFFRDDKDKDYVTKTKNGTTESAYRKASEWNDTSFTGTTLYSDKDNDNLPDWFEKEFGITDPNAVESTLHLGTYSVENTAGYTNLEIAAAFYADDFNY